MKRLVRLVSYGAATAAAAAGGGVTAADDSPPPPPGELFDVEGHATHLYCTGEGGPTVVLDTGLGDSSINFRPLQEQLAELTRVCSYDRAGYGWSEPGPESRTSEQIVAELAALLDAAGEAGPFVLAGHSFGGLNMILHAATHPDDVAGVVLIDASHPDQPTALAAVPEVVAVQDAEIAGLGELATAVEAGEVGPADVVANAPDLPDELHETWAQLFLQPHSLNTAVAEYAALPTSFEQVAANGSLGDIPLVVLAHGLGLDATLGRETLEQLGLTPDVLAKFEQIWRGLQEDHLRRSTNSTLVVADDSPHYIYLSEPELVVDAVRSLIEGSGPATSGAGHQR